MKLRNFGSYLRNIITVKYFEEKKIENERRELFVLIARQIWHTFSKTANLFTLIRKCIILLLKSLFIQISKKSYSTTLLQSERKKERSSY